MNSPVDPVSTTSPLNGILAVLMATASATRQGVRIGRESSRLPRILNLLCTRSRGKSKTGKEASENLDISLRKHHDVRYLSWSHILVHNNNNNKINSSFLLELAPVSSQATAGGSNELFLNGFNLFFKIFFFFNYLFGLNV